MKFTAILKYIESYDTMSIKNILDIFEENLYMADSKLKELCDRII